MNTHLFHLKYIILYRLNMSIISDTTITTSFLLDWGSIYVLHAMTYFNIYHNNFKKSKIIQLFLNKVIFIIEWIKKLLVLYYHL